MALLATFLGVQWRYSFLGAGLTMDPGTATPPTLAAAGPNALYLGVMGVWNDNGGAGTMAPTVWPAGWNALYVGSFGSAAWTQGSVPPATALTWTVSGTQPKYDRIMIVILAYYAGTKLPNTANAEGTGNEYNNAGSSNTGLGFGSTQAVPFSNGGIKAASAVDAGVDWLICGFMDIGGSGVNPGPNKSIAATLLTSDDAYVFSDGGGPFSIIGRLPYTKNAQVADPAWSSTVAFWQINGVGCLMYPCGASGVVGTGFCNTNGAFGPLSLGGGGGFPRRTSKSNPAIGADSAGGISRRHWRTNRSGLSVPH